MNTSFSKIRHIKESNKNLEKRYLKEDDGFLSNLKNKFSNVYLIFKDIISGNIKMYKEIIPGISENYYSKENIKKDAFRHILASAYFTTTIGEKLTWFGGEINEILGAFRNFLKGEGFDSGWIMDTLNNEIGMKIGKKFPKYDINQLSIEVKKIVDSGEFFTNNGIFFKNDKNPKI